MYPEEREQSDSAQISHPVQPPRPLSPNTSMLHPQSRPAMPLLNSGSVKHVLVSSGHQIQASTHSEVGADDGSCETEGLVLGELVGISEGLEDGSAVDGEELGELVGFFEGLEDGEELGEPVGLAEGLEDGEELGELVGFFEGLEDGSAVDGEELGELVGFFEGLEDGFNVGEAVEGLELGWLDGLGVSPSKVKSSDGDDVGKDTGAKEGDDVGVTGALDGDAVGLEVETSGALDGLEVGVTGAVEGLAVALAVFGAAVGFSVGVTAQTLT